jgi:hypothetical protein
MYNYYLIKDPKNINVKKLLLDIKKLLPKYLNSIPNYSALMILDIVSRTNKNNHMLETGVGVSTIALFLGAYLKKKKFYSFDYSQEKISLIKQIINETICDRLKINISDYWTAIPSDSLCSYTGIQSLNELNKNFDFCFLDSNHTLTHLNKELDHFLTLTGNKFYVGIDDAHMKYRKVNIDYVNLIRLKSNLKKLKIQDNICKKFHIEIFQKLKKMYNKTKILKPINKINLNKDPYFKYYGNLIFKPGEKIEYDTTFYSVLKK